MIYFQPAFLNSYPNSIRVVQTIANEMDMTLVDLSQILPNALVISVSMTGSTTSGQPLSETDLEQCLRGCDEARHRPGLSPVHFGALGLEALHLLLRVLRPGRKIVLAAMCLECMFKHETERMLSVEQLIRFHVLFEVLALFSSAAAPPLLRHVTESLPAGLGLAQLVPVHILERSQRPLQ